LYFTYITETSKFNYLNALPWHMRDEKPGDANAASPYPWAVWGGTFL